MLATGHRCLATLQLNSIKCKEIPHIRGELSRLKISFKPLWKLLTDRDMTKEDLRLATGLSAATIAKMGKDGNVTTDVLARICVELGADVQDICECISNDQKERNQ